MAEDSGEHDRSEGAKDKDKGFLKEAVDHLNRDEKERTEKVVEGTAGRIKEASNALREGRLKEASSSLSSGRRRDKAAGTMYKLKGWIKKPQAH